MSGTLIKSSRSENSIRNSMLGVTAQFTHLILSFISRKIFIMMLGAVYLGVNSLFSSILSMLSIAELGFGAAICFTMYKPFATGDEDKINIYLSYYKKIYRVIGFIILAIGLGLMPFLGFFLNGVEYTLEIAIIFLLFLFQTCSSYWFLQYRFILFTASQAQYKIEIFNIIYNILLFALQVAVLLLTKNFILYLLVWIALQLSKNIIVGMYAKKAFPFIKQKPQGSLTKEEKTTLYKNVGGLAMYKISGTVCTSSDSMIISAFVSTVLLGLYANYSVILSAILMFLTTLVNSSMASVGNLYVTGENKDQMKVFKTINLINFWLYGVFSICVWCLISPFVGLFYGQEYILDTFTVFWIVINFCTEGLGNTITLFKDACGLYWKGKIRPIFSTIVNIIASIALAKPFGIAGVLMGTVIARFAVFLWYDTRLVYKNVFHSNWLKFIGTYFIELAFIVGLGYIASYAWELFPTITWWSWIAVGFIVFTLANLIYLLVFWRSSTFVYLRKKVFGFAGKLCRKMGGAIKRVFIKLKRGVFRPVKKLLKKCIVVYKKIGLKLRRKKYVLLISLNKTMDEHIVQFYKQIKDRKLKVKLMCYQIVDRKIVMDVERGNQIVKENGFDKIKVINSHREYLMQNPNLMVAADLYIESKELFPGKKLYIEHGTPTVNDGESKLNYGTGKDAHDENGKPIFDKFFCFTKQGYDYVMQTQPELEGMVEYVGIDLADTIVPRVSERTKFREQFGFSEEDKVVFMIGSWKSDSFFHIVGKGLIEEARRLMETDKHLKFMLSIHPGEYIQYDPNIENLGPYIDEQEKYGFVIRHKGEDIAPYIIASDMVFGDFSAAVETAILVEKPLVYSILPEERLLPCSLAMILKDHVPTIVAPEDLKGLLYNEYPKSSMDKILEVKGSIYNGQEFYHNRVNEVLDNML